MGLLLLINVLKRQQISLATSFYWHLHKGTFQGWLGLIMMVRSELQPIRNFQVWSESWAVHGAVIANKCPEKAVDQFSYFLLLASAQRDIPEMGWLGFDVAFRKQAADKDSVRWGEVMPTLWMTTILSKGALPPGLPTQSPSSPV